MRTKLLALTAAIGMVLFAVGPGVATAAAETTDDGTLAVGVSQAGNQAATVTVTDNGSTVENASVSVEALDNGTYVGAGDYATGENGTVELSAPEENVTIEVTASVGNETATTTAELTAGAQETTESFGVRVSSFIQYLLQHGSTRIGPEVAEFVTQNNPGNAPDHAGPPEDAGPKNAAEENGSDENEPAAERNGERGPPERANVSEKHGPNGDDGTNAGEDSESETEEIEAAETEEAEADEEANEDEATDDAAAEDDDSETDDSEDNGGPPAHANGNGSGR